jgi:signal peptidase I
MQPTLTPGDHILTNKLAYGLRVPFGSGYATRWRSPRAGDVVVFVYPRDRTKLFVKRVVAVAGDVVEVRAKQLFVNDRPLSDPWAHFADTRDDWMHAKRDNLEPSTVPAEHVFVMGDNRDRSYDSRFWGTVRVEDVLGRAAVVYWSADDEGYHWERIGMRLDEAEPSEETGDGRQKTGDRMRQEIEGSCCSISSLLLREFGRACSPPTPMREAARTSGG